RSPPEIVTLGETEGNRVADQIPRWILRARAALLSEIDRRFEPPVSGTLKAMLVGNRYFVDGRIEERLRESATFHVIVIAGLHAGFIAACVLRLVGSVFSMPGG